MGAGCTAASAGKQLDIYATQPTGRFILIFIAIVAIAVFLISGTRPAHRFFNPGILWLPKTNGYAVQMIMLHFLQWLKKISEQQSILSPATSVILSFHHIKRPQTFYSGCLTFPEVFY